MVVSAFGQWVNLTREAPLTNADDIVNDAAKRNYFFGRLMKNRGADVIRDAAGQYFVDKIKLTDSGGFINYQPGDERTYSRTNTSKTIQIPFRFHENSTLYTQAEVMFNDGKDQETIWKNFKRSLMQDLYTAHWNGLESRAWARPDGDIMEPNSATPGLMYSIPAFITENENGSTPYLAPGWGSQTTLQQVNPGTESNYRNAVIRYDHTAPYGSSGIFQAMDNMMLTIRFDPPPSKSEYFENADLNRLMIVTNKNGVNVYSQGLRESNDQTRAGPQDPSYGKPQFKGIPIEYAAQLDEALLDETTGVYSGTAYPDGKPRYFFINGNYLFPVFHKSKMMDLVGPIDGGAARPDTEVLLLDTWCNFVCRSRKRQGIIAPQAAA